MKKLLIDAGNSGVKWSLLEATSVSSELSKMQSALYEGHTPLVKLKDVFEHLKNKFEINEVVLVSVLGEKYISSAKELIRGSGIKFNNVKTSRTLAGVTCAYNEPYKLGADRFVGVIAAHHLDLTRPSIVIDSGTATTIDAVDTDGQHLGGVILPGVNLSTQSLLDKSEMLALFNESEKGYQPSVFSKDTKQAIASGSIFGQVGAIQNICLLMEQEIQQKNTDNKDVNKLICGGSASMLLSYLPEEFKYHEDLLMQGLKIISEKKEKLN